MDSTTVLRIIVACHTRRGGTWVVGSHHLAREWSRAGHNVLFLSAPFAPWHVLRTRDPLLGAQSPHRNARPREVEPRLWEWAPIALLPWIWGAHLGRRLGKSLPSLAVGITGALRRGEFAAPDLLIADHPLFCNLDHVAKASRFVYRATDLYREMHDRPVIDDLERRIIADADCVIATSDPVAQRLRENGAAHPIVIENGAEIGHFSRPAARPPEYDAEDKTRVVYAGAIDFRFDVPLVMRLAAARPAIEFVIIGSGTHTAALEASPLPNVRLLGARPYASLPGYLQHANVALLPLNDHPANAGRSPMKLYEYGAAGLPVLATRTEELARREVPFVRFIDLEDPERSLDALLAEQPLPDPAQIAAHDWSRIAARVLGAALTDAGGCDTVAVEDPSTGDRKRT
jgi:glycosyltransferase involved in cell wall biosynthesis